MSVEGPLRNCWWLNIAENILLTDVADIPQEHNVIKVITIE